MKSLGKLMQRKEGVTWESSLRLFPLAIGYCLCFSDME